MATTTFEELYSDFLFKVQDYQQRNLYLRDEKVATNLCLSFLKIFIFKFTNCKKDIQNPNLDLCVFNVELTLTEKDILTNLMVEAWLNRVCLDITQMNLTLNDNDFKHFAEEKNLEKKIETRDRQREINAQQMWDYDFKNVPWTDWASGNYAL